MNVDLRRLIEQAIETHLARAQTFIELLDLIEGDPDFEPDADGESDLANDRFGQGREYDPSEAAI